MPDALKIVTFALVSFLIGHTFSNKIKDKSVASAILGPDSSLYALTVYRERELSRFKEEKITRSATVSNPYFLHKIDDTKKTTWVKHIGGTPFELPHKLTMDDSSNIYLSGIVNTQFSFNNVSYSLEQANYVENVAYLVKYDSSGVEKWASFIPGLDIYRPYRIWFEGGRPMIEGYFNGFIQRTALWHDKYIYWR